MTFEFLLKEGAATTPAFQHGAMTKNSPHGRGEFNPVQGGNQSRYGSMAQMGQDRCVRFCVEGPSHGLYTPSLYAYPPFIASNTLTFTSSGPISDHGHRAPGARSGMP